MAISSASRSSRSRTMAGTSARPASFAARARLSPATTSYASPTCRTMIGSSTPFSRMLCARSASATGSKNLRGWPSLNRSELSGIPPALASTGASPRSPRMASNTAARSMSWRRFLAIGGLQAGEQLGGHLAHLAVGVAAGGVDRDRHPLHLGVGVVGRPAAERRGDRRDGAQLALDDVEAVAVVARAPVVLREHEQGDAQVLGRLAVLAYHLDDGRDAVEALAVGR